MRAHRWLMVSVLVTTACLSTTNVTPTGEAGEVTLILRGLIALETKVDGLHVLFLSDSTDPHSPTLSVDLNRLSGPPGASPDLTIPDDLGRAIAAWAIDEVTLDPANVDEASISEIAGTVTEKVTDAEKTKIRWVPHMEDIYGATQTLTEAPNLVKARGTFAAGRLEPIFDSSQNKTQRFTIGNRVCTAVADGVRLQVKMKDSLKPLLTFKTGKGDGQILVIPGTTVALASLPQNQTKDHLAHFHHYFGLIQNGEVKAPSECAEGSANTPPTPPAGHPIRCAPVKFP